MVGVAQKLSPAIFVLALICFFLPFVTLSCQGQRVARFTGIQLVVGPSVEEPRMFGPAKTRKASPEPWAVLAFLTVIAGLGLGFLRGKKGAIASALSGALGSVFLLALKSKLENDAMKQGGGVIQTDYGPGFYITLVLLLGAIATNAYVLFQGKGLPLPALGRGGGARFCTQCGARNEASDIFCKECGTKCV